MSFLYIVDKYQLIKDEIYELYKFVLIVTDAYRKEGLPVPVAAKYGYNARAEQINRHIDEFNDDIHNKSRLYVGAQLSGNARNERENYIHWLDTTYDRSPLERIPDRFEAANAHVINR